MFAPLLQYEKILKLTSDARLGERCCPIPEQGSVLRRRELTLPPSHPESGDVKATIAVLGFILSSAAKHNVDGESLSSELQQLGLPKGRGWPLRVVIAGWAWWDGSCAVPSVCVTGIWLQQQRGWFSCLVSHPHRAEHAGGLCRSYEEKQSSLQDRLRACSLRRECGVGGGWGGLRVGGPAR